MIVERTVKINARIRPVNDFLRLVQVRGWTFEEADEVVSTWSGNRLESVPISKVPTNTLFKPFLCPTFGETLIHPAD